MGSKVSKVKLLSRVQLCDPRTVAHLAPLFMEFSRHQYWSGLPFPSPGGLPDPGITPGCPALQADLYCLCHQESPLKVITFAKNIFAYKASLIRSREQDLISLRGHPSIHFRQGSTDVEKHKQRHPNQPSR